MKASEIVKRRRTEIAEILARETGSTISFSTSQMDIFAATLQQVAGWVYLPKGEVLETNIERTTSKTSISAARFRGLADPPSHGPSVLIVDQ